MFVKRDGRPGWPLHYEPRLVQSPPKGGFVLLRRCVFLACGIKGLQSCHILGADYSRNRAPVLKRHEAFFSRCGAPQVGDNMVHHLGDVGIRSHRVLYLRVPGYPALGAVT